MSSSRDFQGFSKDTIEFLSDLRNNNNKKWFEENRSIFDEFVMTEAKGFVTAMGDKLQKITPEIVAVPKTDKSIFRIYRDVRFSKDKRPYKSHLAMWFWEGPGKKMENSGFYFHMEPDKLFIGVGIYMFPPELLQTYRDSVVDLKHGPQLMKAINKIQENPNYQVGWKKYKRTPREYDPEHPLADLLLYGGMGFNYESPIPSELYSDKIIDFTFQIFKDMLPMHTWLKELTLRSAGL